MDFYFLKNPLSARFEPVNLGYSGKHDNHYSTENTFLITYLEVQINCPDFAYTTSAGS
jgi:hypothetical protein